MEEVLKILLFSPLQSEDHPLFERTAGVQHLRGLLDGDKGSDISKSDSFAEKLTLNTRSASFGWKKPVVPMVNRMERGTLLLDEIRGWFSKMPSEKECSASIFQKDNRFLHTMCLRSRIDCIIWS